MGFLELGREAARALPATGRRSGRRAAKELRRELEQVERTRARLSRQDQERLPQAVEWLLDNAYLAQREGRESVGDLRRGKRLRQVTDELYLQALCRALVQECSVIEVEPLAEFLEGVQSERPMTEEELSLFIPAMKGELCRRLARLCQSLDRDPEGEGLAGEMEAVFTSLRTLSAANLGPGGCPSGRPRGSIPPDG